MAIQASGRATFNKVIDGVSSTFTLIPTYGNQIKSKDPVSYAPNFETSNNIITPTLKILASGIQVIRLRAHARGVLSAAARL